MTDLVHPDDRERVAKLLTRAVDLGESVFYMARIVVPDGRQGSVPRAATSGWRGCDAAEQGELGSFRTLQKPAQRGRPKDAQLRRFIGTRSGRNIHYARRLVDELDLTRVPRALDLVLAHV